MLNLYAIKRLKVQRKIELRLEAQGTAAVTVPVVVTPPPLTSVERHNSDAGTVDVPRVRVRREQSTLTSVRGHVSQNMRGSSATRIWPRVYIDGFLVF